MKRGKADRVPSCHSTSTMLFSKTDTRIVSTLSSSPPKTLKARLASTLSSLSKSSSSLLLCWRQLPSFEQLAKRGKFQEIATVLRDDQINPPKLEKWLHKSCVGEETALHRLLRYRPPEELFDLLIHRLSSFHGGGDDSGASSSPVTLSSSSVSPSPSLNGGDSGSSPGESSGCTWSHYSSSFDEDALLASPLLYIPECAHDPLGRTPLHIAAAVGCHVPIIHRLLDGATCASPAFVTDDKGRCPLHWACENPHGSERVVLPNSKRDSLLSSSMIMCKSTSRRFVSRAATSSSATGTAAAAANLENMMGVIRALLNAYPEAVNIPDKDGMTPVDLACKANACPMLIQMLEETAKLYPKNRWTMWEEAEDVMMTSH